MCRVLEISVSGYYDWLRREPSAHEREDGELAKHIQRIFHAHRGVYGSPRVHVELRTQGIRCSRERTARLMREMDLAAKRRRNKPIGTKQRKGTQMAPNVLNRQFNLKFPYLGWQIEKYWSQADNACVICSWIQTSTPAVVTSLTRYQNHMDLFVTGVEGVCLVPIGMPAVAGIMNGFVS